jgi:XTP/dITP diphosphohydrolase
MAVPPTLAIATRNPGKVREFLQICADWPASWVTFHDADWPVVSETGATYVENARLKAAAVAGTLGFPAVADDSGVEVDHLGGAPGLRSARFAGEDATDDQNLRLLIDRIREAPADGRTARYRCVALCSWPGGGEIWAEATCEGTLVTEPRGSNGFGYDPIFVPLGESRTMAELSDEEKHRISHRGKALRALGAMLADLPEPPIEAPDQGERP